MNKRYIVGISAPKSTLAKRFQKTKLFVFKKYNNDINNYEKFSKWLSENNSINYFVNFAAITSSKESNKKKKKVLQTNYKSVIGILNIINRSNLNNFKYFLAISSSHVFKKSRSKLIETSKKDPDSIYGLSKLLMERDIIKKRPGLKFKIGIARIFNYYDKRSNNNFFIHDIKKKLKLNKNTIKFENVNCLRDFIDPDDIINALLHMIKHRLSSDYNICSGKGFYLESIINYLNNDKKKLKFTGKKNMNLVGNNNKLKRTGWSLKKKINYELFD